MQTIAIRSGRDGRPSLVQRRHDLSGVDYEHIVTIEDGLAQALDDRGVCVWSEDVARAQGRPAVVLHAVPGGKARLEVRADGVDPTTVMVEACMDAVDARCCVSQGEATRIDWCGRQAA